MSAYLPLLADVGHGHMDWDGGWWIVMVVGMAVFWGLVIVGGVWAVRELTRSRADRTGEPPAGERRADDAAAILDRRLASGEISAEEYRELRAVLRGEDPAARDS